MAEKFIFPHGAADRFNVESCPVGMTKYSTGIGSATPLLSFTITTKSLSKLLMSRPFADTLHLLLTDTRATRFASGFTAITS
jgi:hypothetical protein